MARIDIPTQGKRKQKIGYETFVKWVKVDLPAGDMSKPEKFLATVNQILSEQSSRAWDHERGGEMFHGAALVKTIKGNYYVAANVHLQNSPTTRNCAEANAITEAVNTEGINTQITDVWFMGGRGDHSKGIPIFEHDLGRRSFPCGSCRDVIFNNKMLNTLNMNGATRIHVLPVNNGTLRLLPDNGTRGSNMPQNMVMTVTINDLMPNVTYTLPDADGALKKAYRDGWELINDKQTAQAIDMAMQSAALLHLKEMKGSAEDRIKAINNLMMDTLRDLNAKSSHPVKSARVAVVRLDNGEYYLGVSFKNNVTPSMQDAEMDAIQTAHKIRPTGHSITDIFVMSVDFDKAPEMLKEFDNKPGSGVILKTPDGAMRERISRAGPNNGEHFNSIFGEVITCDTGANVHVMMINNKKDFDPKKHMVSFTLDQLLPYRYISPKMSMQFQTQPGIS